MQSRCKNLLLPSVSPPWKPISPYHDSSCIICMYYKLVWFHCVHAVCQYPFPNLRTKPDRNRNWRCSRSPILWFWKMGSTAGWLNISNRQEFILKYFFAGAANHLIKLRYIIIYPYLHPILLYFWGSMYLLYLYLIIPERRCLHLAFMFAALLIKIIWKRNHHHISLSSSHPPVFQIHWNQFSIYIHYCPY